MTKPKPYYLIQKKEHFIKRKELFKDEYKLLRANIILQNDYCFKLTKEAIDLFLLNNKRLPEFILLNKDFYKCLNLYLEKNGLAYFFLGYNYVLNVAIITTDDIPPFSIQTY